MKTGLLPRAAAAILAAVALAGCASSTRIVAPCCYDGPYTETRLADLELTLAGGRVLGFGEVFAGYAADEALLLRPLPFERQEIGLVIYPLAAAAFERYDVNGDGLMDQPELLALYVREAAAGLGREVTAVAGSAEPVALATANADVSGLLRLLERRRGDLSERARRLFDEIERIGLDQQQEGSEGADLDTGSFVP